MKFNGVKVFSATMFRDHAMLGEKVTEWIKQNPQCEILDKIVTQSSDSEFHCITITLFYADNPRVAQKEVWDPSKPNAYECGGNVCHCLCGPCTEKPPRHCRHSDPLYPTAVPKVPPTALDPWADKVIVSGSSNRLPKKMRRP